MREIRGRDIVHRYEENPIIVLNDLSFSCLNIMNAGAIKVNGEYLLLVRIETLKGVSVLFLARSKDGIRFKLEETPVMEPSGDEEYFKFETQGVADARITFLDGWYYIVYTALSGYGQRLGLAKTKDFKTIERVGFISEPDNHNGAFFSKKFGDYYVRVERPRERANIWISYSKDLLYWGRSEKLMSPRGGSFWDAHRIGTSVPPIEISEGWLLIYYGVKTTSCGPIFRLGAAILHRDIPSRVIARSDVPILSPREYYERVGDTSNMIFSSGAILEDDKDSLKIYYGGANMGINLGTASVKKIVKNCFEG